MFFLFILSSLVVLITFYALCFTYDEFLFLRLAPWNCSSFVPRNNSISIPESFLFVPRNESSILNQQSSMVHRLSFYRPYTHSFPFVFFRKTNTGFRTHLFFHIRQKSVQLYGSTTHYSLLTYLFSPSMSDKITGHETQPCPRTDQYQAGKCSSQPGKASGLGSNKPPGWDGPAGLPGAFVDRLRAPGLVPSVSCRPEADDPVFVHLLEASRTLDLMVGFVDEDTRHRFYIASAYLSQGTVLHVHHKVYLPTYGLFDEGRFFAPGDCVARL